jgi:predicted GIY-YIG superfamily endonuclease
MVYTEQFPDKEKAMQREQQLKSWKSKVRIHQLINRSSTQ